MLHFLLVFLGGGLGSICRYGISIGLQPWQLRFPLATLAANGLACVVLGAVLGLQVGSQMPERYRLLLATGFCGGFSTFSTFTAETWQLAQSGQTSTALINVAANMGVCVLGLLLGMKLVH